MSGISDLVSILQTEYAKRHGVEESVLRRNGVISAEVAAVELRSRGYKVEVSPNPRGGRKLKLLAMPVEGAKERFADQQSLFSVSSKDSTRGAYDE